MLHRPFGTRGSSEVVIDVESQIEIGEHFAAPAMQDQRARAVGPDDLANMGGKNHGAVGSFFEQLLVRPALEALIARSDDLVDQVAVKIDRERQCEHEPGRNPGEKVRNGSDRNLPSSAKSST